MPTCFDELEVVVDRLHPIKILLKLLFEGGAW